MEWKASTWNEEEKKWHEIWHQRAKKRHVTYQHRRYGKNYRVMMKCDFCDRGYFDRGFNISTSETHALMHARESRTCQICIPEELLRIYPRNENAILDARKISKSKQLNPEMMIKHHLKYHQKLVHYCILCDDRFSSVEEYLEHCENGEAESPVIVID